MTDKQEGTKADQFPKDEHHHEIVGQHNAEHGKHEERKRRKVARFALIIAHVTERVDMNERTYAANENQHGLAQGIEDKTDRHTEDSGKFDPGDFRHACARPGEDDTATNETDQNRNY